MRFLLLILLLPMLARAEPATLVRASELKAQPASDAPTVTQLAVDAAVDAGERSGGWVRVRTAAGAQGWVKMLALKYGGPGVARKGDSGLTQAINVARTGASGTQVTTGVRGLDEQQLANARPNPAELEKMKQFAADRGTASSFASEGSLAAKTVEYPK